MRKFTRTLSCALIAALLLTVAATAAACGKKAEYPTVSEVTGSQAAGEVIPAVDRQEQLAAAKKANPDAVAWLYMPGAEVDDAVMQAADNGYYLQKDENGNFSEWGCYYAHCDDHLGSRSALDKNTVIFGHSATNCDPDGPKFTKLHRYMDADFVQENPYIYLSVEGDDMVFQITACFITDTSFDYISPDLAGEELYVHHRYAHGQYPDAVHLLPEVRHGEYRRPAAGGHGEAAAGGRSGAGLHCAPGLRAGDALRKAQQETGKGRHPKGACLLCCVQASPRKKRGTCSKAQPLSPAQKLVDLPCPKDTAQQLIPKLPQLTARRTFTFPCAASATE